MKSRWTRRMTTLLVGAAMLLTFSTMSTGCGKCKRCCNEPCAKKCPPGCTKPCCAKGAEAGKADK